MPRALAATIALLVAAAVLVASGRGGAEREAALAALAFDSLLTTPVVPVGVDEREAEQYATLGERLLHEHLELVEGSDPPRGVLTLGEVVLDVPASAGREAAARRSVVRGLRKAAERGVRPHGPVGRIARGPDGEEAKAERERLSLDVTGELEPAAGGIALRAARDVERGTLSITWQRDDGSSLVASHPWTPPDRGSLLPPLVAIALAIATRKPLLSLAIGVLLGAVLVRLRDGAAWTSAVVGGGWDVPSLYFWDKLNSVDKLQIIAFVVLMLAMVGNLTRNGGIQGLMELLRRLARGPRSTQGTTYAMGLAVFFDDYANTVLVGSTMRPLADRFRVAREKLAYIVDSTAAPVAGISVLSTWIAFEVSTFSAQLPAAGLLSSDGYQVFLQTLPYRFYCILTLLLVGLVALTGRDLGPMLAAERRTRRTGQLVREGSRPMVGSGALAHDMAPGVRPAAWRALVPLCLFVGVTLFEIARRGGAFAMGVGDLFTLPGITQVLYDGSGNWPLMIGGAAGFVAAAIASVSAGVGRDILPAAWRTLSSMGIALGILYFAWMIGDVCDELGTASFLATVVEGALHPALLPALLFALSAGIAFATGTSWGTMSILLPLVIGLSFQLGHDLPIGGIGLMVLSIGAVLEGAIFGDHCSPISDTTVLSSISSGCDLMDHVRTQAPYALITMATALVCGYLPCALLQWSPWLSLAVSTAVLVVLVRFVFSPVTEAGAVPDGEPAVGSAALSERAAP